MFINLNVMPMSLGFMTFTIGVFDIDAATQAGAVTLLFVFATLVMNKLFTMLNRRTTESEKIDLIYKKIYGMELVNSCRYKDECPLIKQGVVHDSKKSN